MNNELQDCAKYGNLGRVKQLVEGGANIEEANEYSDGMTALSLASLSCQFETVVYLVEQGANIAHTYYDGMTALHCAAMRRFVDKLETVTYLLEHGARITERSDVGKTALLYSVQSGSLELVQYLISSEGGASITETDDEGNTALLLAARSSSYPTMVQWLLEFGGAQITDTNNEGTSVWTQKLQFGLKELLKSADTKVDDGKNLMVLTAMLRVMVLHGAPPQSLVEGLAPPLQQIVHDGARLRARLPAYLAQRRALLDAHCSLLAPLTAIVHSYEELTTTDELWATGLGAP
jgi:ankyrin repeat protein